ncbi:MAG: phosphoribosylaminoimidazole carboxylase catalytic subunit [Candidatus Scalindua rubra]|uniref:N5-carboxyaminoimidazole ribonucleotide mutase n=1 Tax=Candidatus Scalindua rubra TaxID=1872076 RepID=A0A1E3X7D5_9BACT|nr:MAG: phosphoribosylaminoimidazole carboxylase catalytic subunit [Candidatus Scalindua rubra]
MPDKKIGIVMGSDSDLSTMQETLDVLNEFGVKFDVDVVSCHRSPQRAHKYAMNAEKKGYKVIIGGAGGAAHLAGVIASMTPVPVIGVPMLTPDLGGLDSLYSIVQMPAGVPVAAVGIGKAGAKNAAILAIQILSTSDKGLKKKIVDYKKKAG